VSTSLCSGAEPDADWDNFDVAPPFDRPERPIFKDVSAYRPPFFYRRLGYRRPLLYPRLGYRGSVL